MTVRIETRAEWAEQLASAVDDVRPELEFLVLDWARPDAAARLDEVLCAGGAVLALCHDLDAIASALDAGASEAMRWPDEAPLLSRRIRSAIRLSRVPFLERLRELVADSVEYTNPQVQILDVNPAFEDVTGYARHEVLGKSPAELFRAEVHDPEYYRQIGEAMASGDVWRGQLAARRQDGSLSFQHATIGSVRDAQGREVGHLAIKRDTSRDNLARAALEGAAGPIQTLMDRAAEAVLVHTLDGRLADANHSASILLGRPREELLELHAADLYADDPAWLVASWARLELDRPRTSENRWRRADGSTIPVELSIGRAQLVGSEFVLVVARDITSRREAESEAARSSQALQQLNDRLEAEVAERTRALGDTLAQQHAILHHLAEGLVAATPTGRIHVINPRMIELLDIQGHYLGLPIERLDRELAELARRCIVNDAPLTEELVRAGDRTLEVLASPIHGDQGEGELIGTVMLARDITLAKEVDRMKTDFIATVSHELRTPLTSVLGFAKLALGKLDRIAPHVPDDDRRATRAFDQVRSNLEIIAAEGNRLSALINDVLDISKMESGRVDWSEDAIRPEELVAHVVEVTSALFSDGGPALVREIEPDLPELIGDRHRLIQVLINLVSNAVKFTAEGAVTLAVGRSAEGLEFSVRDTGSGIPTSDIDAIFERFKQSSDTRADRPRGTGLGLPISKAIIEHHGGRIGVESTVGEGSRFWFTLPVRSATQSHAPPSALGLAPLLAQIERVRATSGPAEILVADDDPALRELMRQLLSDAGHRVRLAENGTQAIDMVRAHAPDLLILDVVMPGLSGFDVAAVIRSDPKTERLPILVVSILSDEARGVQVGVDRYLTKPVEPDELFDAVAALLTPDNGRRVLISCDDPKQTESIRTYLESMGDVVVGTCGSDDCSEVAGESRADLVVLVGASNELVDRLKVLPGLAHARVLALVDP